MSNKCSGCTGSISFFQSSYSECVDCGFQWCRDCEAKKKPEKHECKATQEDEEEVSETTEENKMTWKDYVDNEYFFVSENNRNVLFVHADCDNQELIHGVELLQTKGYVFDRDMGDSELWVKNKKEVKDDAATSDGSY